jgi:hypothetical protein
MNSVIYLSTLSTTTKATKNANNTQVSWNVSWNDVFPQAEGLQLTYSAYVKLRTQKSNTIQFNNLGSLRCSLLSNYNINNFGTVLGMLDVDADPIDTGYVSIVCDTTLNSHTVVINQPSSNATFTVYLCDKTEQLIPQAIPDFDMEIVFEPYKHDSFKHHH